jgi:peptidyl-prolyl cis-trans isomerase SurA
MRLVALLWIVFLLYFMMPTVSVAQFAPPVIDEIVAKVDNHIIMRSEIEFAYIQAVAEGQRDNGALKCRLLESLIISKMLLAKAEIDSVSVEEEQVAQELDGRMNYMISSFGGDRERIEKQYGKSIEQLKSELKRQVKEQLIAQKMQQEITKEVKVTPAQVRRFFNAIPEDSLPYYSTEVEVGQIVRYPTPNPAQKESVKKQLQEIRNRIVEKGESFSDLARLYSQDPGSAAAGGELGFWKRGEMVPEFEANALKLKPNDISEVFESKFGFHIVQLIERRGNEYNSRHILMKPPAAQNDIQFTKDYLDSLRNAILNDSISFEKAARDFSAEEVTKAKGGFFTDRVTGGIRIPLDRVPPDVFFIIDTLKVGTISRPIYFKTEDGKEAVRIVYYRSRIAPHRANLKDDYQKLFMATEQKKKGKAIKEWFEKTKEEVYISIHERYQNCDILKEI